MDYSKYKWLGEAPEFDDSAIEEVIETDVIICGAGIAGVAATRTAAEMGAECVLFEKSSRPQGRSGQFAAVGSKFLKNHWNTDISNQATEIVAALAQEMGYWVKQPILKYFIENEGEAMDWYLEGLPKENVFIANEPTDVPPKGTKIHILFVQHPMNDNYCPTAERHPVYHSTIQLRPSHIPVLKNNLQMAVDTGLVRTFFETPVKKLLREDNHGRVYGVIAQDYNGHTVKAIARKGVILATGDYAGNRDMLEQYCPAFSDSFLVPMGFAPDKSRINTGDGHRMGMWVGAKMEEGPHSVDAHNMGAAMGVTPYLQLNADGKRFMKEDIPGAKVEVQISLQKGQFTWQFFDGGWREQIPHMPFGHGSCTHVIDDDALDKGEVFDDLTPLDGYASQHYLDKMVAEGKAERADTLEELIEKTGLPKDTALASIARYNELARKGSDDDFGKKAECMFAIEKPPFYATKLTRAALLHCCSGLESDEYAHCLDKNGDVIPGLYVVGNVQGNRITAEYPTVIPGYSHAVALTYGRRAAQCAVEGI